MCGTFVVEKNSQVITDYWIRHDSKLSKSQPELLWEVQDLQVYQNECDGNSGFSENLFKVFPGHFAPILVKNRSDQNQEQLHIFDAKWGLIPPWWNKPAAPSQTFNARCETVFEKPTFKKAILQFHCLVPAKGFIEWKRTGEQSPQQYFIQMNQGELMWMAGIYEPISVNSPSPTFSILTTVPNQEMSVIHDRMPVILNSMDAISTWLNPDDSKWRDLLLPLENFQLNIKEIQTNKPKNNLKKSSSNVDQIDLFGEGES